MSLIATVKILTGPSNKSNQNYYYRYSGSFGYQAFGVSEYFSGSTDVASEGEHFNTMWDPNNPTYGWKDVELNASINTPLSTWQYVGEIHGTPWVSGSVYGSTPWDYYNHDPLNLTNRMYASINLDVSRCLWWVGPPATPDLHLKVEVYKYEGDVQKDLIATHQWNLVDPSGSLPACVHDAQQISDIGMSGSTDRLHWKFYVAAGRL